MDRWLTPQAAASGVTCRRLLIPGGNDWYAIVVGCLLELCKEYNFEQFGSVTPYDTAQAFTAMFDDFSLQGINGGCRVIGEIIAYGASTSPDARWLPCDGSSLLRSDYPDLFTVIGVSYGAADGAHFNVPDLRGRTPIMAGTGSGLTPRSIGDVIGEEAHTLTTTEMPSHTHTEGTAAPTAITIGPGAPAPSAIPSVGITGSAGLDGAHNNMQPSLVINYFIVAKD